jgi:hypothetical protein
MSVPSMTLKSLLPILLAALAGPLWAGAAPDPVPTMTPEPIQPAAPAPTDDAFAPPAAGVETSPGPVSADALAQPATPSATVVAATPALPSPPGSVSSVSVNGYRDYELASLVYSLANNRASQFVEPVLVVPNAEAEPQSFDALVEDLSIMSRIIQRDLSEGHPLLGDVPAMSSLLLLVGQSRGLGPHFFFPVTRRPKALYVGGYGALFFLQVDFPLLPPAEQLEQGAAEQQDPVWAETRRSLFEPQMAVLPNGTPTAEPYDEGKVQILQDRLTNLLRHATNIRSLAPDEWLVIVVQGAAAEPSVRAPLVDNGLLTPPAGGRTLLMLRARKADIDAYAKDQLDPEQFEQRLQLIISR